MNIVKQELIRMLAEKESMNLMEAKWVFEKIIRQMRDALKRQGRIEIRGFGSFSIRSYEGYQGRNPKTHEKIQVQPKKLVFFKPGKELKNRIDKK